MKINGKYVTTITVVDPDSKGEVQVEIYKLDSGAMVGIDGSFLESETEAPVYSPYDKGVEIHPDTFEQDIEL